MTSAPSIQAVTAYGVAIPKSFPNPKAAKAWAVENRSVFPGLSVKAPTKKGLRTIWRDVSEVLS